MIKNGVHGYNRESMYVEPKDPLIKERLEWFKDQKLALMMHFGPYSQMAINCSWPLPESAAWARAEVDWVDDLDEFRKQYFDQNKSFNPMRIQPDKWADFAAENGFRYLIFTTKHHDGFCMFDTKYTDYKVTGTDCPFHTHKYANIVREVFEAFRQKGLGIGAYFSKPDWHCPWFWAEGMDKPVGFNHYPTYIPAEHPEVWEKFIEFTHNQIMELMTDYGKIDILWLDGGQVKPVNGLDIRLSDVVNRAREIQPWLITADRTVGGENENYITPEQTIPDHVIKVPWESCITVGRGWVFRYNDTYKTSRQLVKMLVEVVSRGGNLALNIGPQPNGVLPEQAVESVKGLGNWLKINGDAIYGTRALDVPQTENVMFTKKGDIVYVIIPLSEGETLGEQIFIPTDKNVKKITCLGYSDALSFQKTEKGVMAVLPKEAVGDSPYAVAFRLE